MNQDQVKEALVALKPTKVDFTLLYSGKKSAKVNGLYKPATMEIVIHNRNFETDNDLFFTALHEYAHHLNCTEFEGSSGKAHTLKFWSILHTLLGLAEEKGLYKNPAKTEAFAPTTESLRGLITESGRIMREIGSQLIEAQGLCQKNGARFDDYVMRTLKQSMSWARSCMAAAAYKLDDSLGAENMKSVAGIRGDEDRQQAAIALSGEESPQQVKAARKSGQEGESEDAVARLEKEKKRTTTTIEHLQTRLEELERRIEELTNLEEKGTAPPGRAVSAISAEGRPAQREAS
jgi:hypothetical protein